MNQERQNLKEYHNWDYNEDTSRLSYNPQPTHQPLGCYENNQSNQTRKGFTINVNRFLLKDCLMN